MEKRRKGTGGEGKEGKHAGSKFSRFFITSMNYILYLCVTEFIKSRGKMSLSNVGVRFLAYH